MTTLYDIDNMQRELETFKTHPLVHLQPGDIVWTWCSKAMDRADHLYQPGKTPPMLCLHCFPECDPRKEQE